MNEELRNFILGNKNVIETKVLISREVAPNGQHYVYIKIDDLVLYSFWWNPERKNEKPKHTGGKKPYVMVILDEVEKLKKQKIPNLTELIGFLFMLSPYIEWHTGRLIKKRSKKPLKRDNLREIFGGSKYRFEKILSDLEKYGLLSHTKEGYFVSQKLIKKGASRRKNEEENEN